MLLTRVLLDVCLSLTPKEQKIKNVHGGSALQAEAFGLLDPIPVEGLGVEGCANVRQLVTRTIYTIATGPLLRFSLSIIMQ